MLRFYVDRQSVSANGVIIFAKCNRTLLFLSLASSAKRFAYHISQKWIARIGNWISVAENEELLSLHLQAIWQQRGMQWSLCYSRL